MQTKKLDICHHATCIRIFTTSKGVITNEVAIPPKADAITRLGQVSGNRELFTSRSRISPALMSREAWEGKSSPQKRAQN